jgi:hypothetical protein
VELTGSVVSAEVRTSQEVTVQAGQGKPQRLRAGLTKITGEL